MIDAAVAMARRLGEEEALATLLPLSVLVDWRPERTSERRSAAAESVAIARRAGDPQMALWARIARFVDAFGDGDMPAADGELAAYDRLVSELRQPYYEWYGMVLQATRSTFAGSLDDARRLADAAAALIREHDPDSDQERTVQGVMLARARGVPHEADLETLRACAARYPAMRMWQALTADLEWSLGLHDEAERTVARCAGDDFRPVPADADRVATLGLPRRPAPASAAAERSCCTTCWRRTRAATC